jgi:hypothetical protein
MLRPSSGIDNIMVRVKSLQDFWADVLFLAFGCAALWIGRGYAFGTSSKMAPRVRPL